MWAPVVRRRAHARGAGCDRPTVHRCRSACRGSLRERTV